jgi:Carboxypeptidase regulatory-like domain
VEIKNVETNLSTKVKTNKDGLYTIPSLRPGHYRVNVRRPGFKSVTVTEVELNIQDNVVRNFALQVGSITETVTVNGNDMHLTKHDGCIGEYRGG